MAAWWNGTELLCHRASVLLPDIARRDLNVDHGGLDLGMSNELPQGWQADACPDHVGSEGVSKPLPVGLRNAGGSPVMTKQRA
jgi:hypothetical protein